MKKQTDILVKYTRPTSKNMAVLPKIAEYMKQEKFCERYVED